MRAAISSLTLRTFSITWTCMVLSFIGGTEDGTQITQIREMVHLRSSALLRFCPASVVFLVIDHQRLQSQFITAGRGDALLAAAGAGGEELGAVKSLPQAAQCSRQGSDCTSMVEPSNGRAEVMLCQAQLHGIGIDALQRAGLDQSPCAASCRAACAARPGRAGRWRWRIRASSGES